MTTAYYGEKNGKPLVFNLDAYKGCCEPLPRRRMVRVQFLMALGMALLLAILAV